MLFDKRKKKRAEELLKKERLLVEKQFAADIQKAAQIEDPAKKIVAFQYISNAIQSQLLKQDMDISKQAEQSGKKTSKRVGWGTVAGGLTALVLIAHPIGWGVLLGGAAAGMAGTAAASSARENFVEKKLTGDAASHTQRLTSLHSFVEEVIKEIVAINAGALQNTPQYEQLKKTYGISDEFIAAAQQRAAQVTKAAPAAKEAPAKGVLKKNGLK